MIGIAETNLDKCHKDLYKIPGYVSEYNEKFADKIKGSGVALYIKENIFYNRIDAYYQCTKNLESLFIRTTNTDTPLTIGIVYRPLLYMIAGAVCCEVAGMGGSMSTWSSRDPMPSKSNRPSINLSVIV